jgi:hypothetical protein
MGEAKRREMIMEEEKEKAEEALKPDAEPQKFIAKMEIVMFPDGRISVFGPINNKSICKALLAGASQSIDEYKSKIFIPGRG